MSDLIRGRIFYLDIFESYYNRPNHSKKNPTFLPSLSALHASNKGRLHHSQRRVESRIHIDFVDGHRKFYLLQFSPPFFAFALLAPQLDDLLECFLNELFLNLHLVVGTDVCS